MTRLAAFLVAFGVATLAYAHGNNDHIRGTVTKTTATSITIETAGTPTKSVVVKVAAHTTVEKMGRAATVKDIHVGDRVVVDVPKGTLEAHSIRVGAPAKPSSGAA